MKKILFLAILFLITVLLYGCNTPTTGNGNKDSNSSQLIPSQSKQNTSNTKANNTLEKDQSKVSDNKKNELAKEKVQINLKLGDNGEKVTELQTKLNKFGYKLTTDGKFGASTDFAVRNFQQKLNILSDGIAGQETLNKLDSTPVQDPYIFKPLENKNTSSQAISSTNSYETFINSKDCPSDTDYLIYTNLSKHIVYVFTGTNHNWKLINSFSCSSGKSSTPTIKGHFTLGTRGSSFTTDNGLICKWYTQISGNYLFHSILYDKNGNIVDSRLGENISHGCIRLATSNAKYLYDNIPSGTAIWIL
ncbi:L,D-transpeptidase [Clostridium sp. DJ247]|uniref:L,D-transpeptidase family protein n=1 Tax=Clostridium sp. DJ247 TaxID=2726188 RepID=UPI00162771A6|nr:L,D-transpeptidase [Clostridium sp. DJ247]MBC2582413.1 L,D-transpeptidase family protein [Clostridium sp. DJ247]